jgi:uncharacterized damage-inducible protein DinB
MSIADGLLTEFDLEMASTRTVLSRVPEEKFGWKPHPRSTPMGELAQHLATIPSYGQAAFKLNELDLASLERPAPPTTRQEVLDLFDASVRGARAVLASARDESFNEPWTLRVGARTVFTLPRSLVFRRMVLSHIIHHRGQMTVYLRLNDIPVPGTMGPTADEPM